jgi:hypothetical protein
VYRYCIGIVGYDDFHDKSLRDARGEASQSGPLPAVTSTRLANAAIRLTEICHDPSRLHLVAQPDEIEQAAGIVYAGMAPTPQLCWPLLNQALGAEVWVKHENHAPTGAFKVRGGMVYLHRLAQQQPQLSSA